jgi:hydroxycarboxylate dehydrogenase B
VPHVPVEQLLDLSTRIFAAAGAPPPVAHRVADALVKSDLIGVHSHGTNLLPQYVRHLASGRIQPAALPTIAKESAATAVVDGHHGFGQVAAEYAAHLAVQKAKAEGIGIVCCVHSNHIGRIGEYTEMCAHDDVIGFCVVNAGPQVTPFGGLAQRFGTNPIAFSVPVPGSRPLLVDFATSAAASNKVLVARNKGIKIPKGWILDREGAESDDPNDLFNGGYLLTFGTYKGYGLSIMVEILGGLLSGTGSAMFDEYPGGNGVFVMALSPDFFRPSEEFLADVRRLVDTLRATPPLDGVAKVLVPGDPEDIVEARYCREGIELNLVTWQEILDAAKSVGVAYEA